MILPLAASAAVRQNVFYFFYYLNQIIKAGVFK